jgi:hypothetical protein
MTSQTFGRGALLGLAALTILGCGQPPDQFIIVQDQVPMQPGCLIPTTIGSVYQSEGFMDVRLVFPDTTIGYEIFPVVRNNLPGNSGSSGDPNRIALSAFEVDVSVADDAPQGVKDMFAAFQTSGPSGAPDQMIKYRSLTSGSVTSEGGTAASAVTGVPADLARALRASGHLQGAPPFHLISTVRAVGKTTTRTVTSDPFDFPITVCDGCLIRNAVGGEVPTCPLTYTPATGNSCNIAQDGYVDCCQTGAGELVCPGMVAIK